MSISVLISAYNEQASVADVTREVVTTLDAVGQPYEVLLIDDGSTDGTSEIADRMAAKYDRVIAIHHGENRGLGGVYRTAFSHATCDYLTIIPGDGEVPASTIPTFLSLIDDMDMVLGFLPEGKFRANGKPDWRSRLLSGTERKIYRLLFGTFPRFQGNLMFRRKLLAELPLSSTGRGWLVMTEVIIRASQAGYRIASVPIEMRPRVAGKSKVKNARMAVIIFRQIISLWLHMRWKH
jgi:dolichol-phosphate mannosyltransferase